jgi:sigma-B regulation protein RsbU (phosphoserine phosphatase)
LLRWTGHEEADIVGEKRFVDLLTPGSRAFYETSVRPALHLRDEVSEVALELVRADGSVLPVLLNAILERDATGAIALVRIAVFDATERRRYEQQLIEAKKRAEASEKRLAVVARTLQETLMPPRAPRVDGLEVATAYRPAGAGDEIGGDFYDVFELADGDWVVTIGDVAGKGVEAAVVATLARHTIRAVTISEPSPARVLDQLNQVVLGDASGRFLTAVVLRMRRAGDHWDVTMSVGGHPPAVLLAPGAEPVAVGGPGHLVGAFEFAQFEDIGFELPPGATVLLITDGVTEARGDADFYGEDRLMALRADASGGAAAVTELVLGDVLDFQHGLPRDDVSMVALTCRPEDQRS